MIRIELCPLVACTLCFRISDSKFQGEIKREGARLGARSVPGHLGPKPFFLFPSSLKYLFLHAKGKGTLRQRTKPNPNLRVCTLGLASPSFFRWKDVVEAVANTELILLIIPTPFIG